MRVPDVPPKPIDPVVRLTQFRDGGYVLISHCSAGAGHQHTLDYDDLIAQHGDAEVDYAFKVAMTCPECGAPGGGMTVLCRVPSPEERPELATASDWPHPHHVFGGGTG